MIIYKTTNLINGKIYVGQHNKDNDNYLGSGKLLKRAIKKYSKENFVREILEYCNTRKELNEREIYWIEELKARTHIGYNLNSGGTGGDTLSNHPNKKEIGDKISKANSGKNNGMYGKKGLDWPFYGKPGPMTGLKHSEKTKRKMSESHKGEKSYWFGKKLSKNIIKKMSKPFLIDDKEYMNLREAKEKLGIPESTTYYRLKSDKFYNYKYIEN